MVPASQPKKTAHGRFSTNRTWAPSASGSAFFGYVPKGNVLSVVKILSDGTA